MSNIDSRPHRKRALSIQGQVHFDSNVARLCSRSEFFSRLLDSLNEWRVSSAWIYPWNGWNVSGNCHANESNSLPF